MLSKINSQRDLENNYDNSIIADNNNILNLIQKDKDSSEKEEEKIEKT